MGDLNFRLEYPIQKTLQILSEINEENWQTSLNFLINREQLTLLRKGYDWLNEYKEMKIDFLPTYKYDGSSENYDKSSKRIPSWCDRILWKEGRDSEKIVIPVCYKRRETKFSDHKPVVGLFTILPDQTAPDVIVQEEETLEKLPSYHPSKNKSLSKQLETEGDFTERFSMTLDSTDFNY